MTDKFIKLVSGNLQEKLADHGDLNGLGDDDHSQYLTTGRHDSTSRHSLGSVVPHDSHGSLSNLGNDDHSQYLTTGRHDTTGRHTLGSIVPHDTYAGVGADPAGAASSAVANHAAGTPPYVVIADMLYDTAVSPGAWQLLYWYASADPNGCWHGSYYYQAQVAGYYLVNATILTTGTAAGIYMALFKNGSLARYGNSPVNASGFGGLTTLIYLAAGEYVAFYIFTGAGCTLNAATSPYSCMIQICRLH